MGSSQPHVYLDLESERDRSKLDQAELYLQAHLDKLVILDKVHRVLGLFALLRGLIRLAEQVLAQLAIGCWARAVWRYCSNWARLWRGRN